LSQLLKRKISGYCISLVICLGTFLQGVSAQDTLLIPLKIKIGAEVSGPATYFIEKKNLSAEGYIAVDLNEKISAVLGAGYLNYSYSQFNYDYLNKGMFIRAGVDFNLLKPEKSMGKYWAGIGLRYGLSVFNSEIPSFKKENYWGLMTSSIPQKTNWGHFVEVNPGVRAEIFRNISIGWTISLRMLVYTGTGKDLRPIYFPGFGNGAKTVSTGINYFLVWSIPYKKIRVIQKIEVPEETDETGTTGVRQQGSGIRQ
jgi:hypothetical protein